MFFYICAFKNETKMISFENIHKPNWMYSALHPYIELMHNFVFYRNFYVLHK